MRIIKSFWKTILSAVVVLVLSTISGNTVEEVPIMQIPHMDKVAHYGMYFLFTIILLFDLSHFKGRTISWRQIIFYSLVFAIAYGGIMELLQEIRSLHRSTDIKDFIANSAGAFTAVLCYKYVAVFLNKLQAIFIKPGNNYSL